MTPARRHSLTILFRAAVSGLMACAFCQASQADEPEIRSFLQAHCSECHDSQDPEAKLDLSALPFDLQDRQVFAKWVLIHDRVQKGEMPPLDAEPLDPADRLSLIQVLSNSLLAADEARIASQGRATQRRMNRYEYENTIRDLLDVPCLEVKEFLPEEGEVNGFNKSAEALDVSYVQISRFLSAAEYALRAAMAPQAERPETTTKRYYAWDQPGFGYADADIPIRASYRLSGYDLLPPRERGWRRQRETATDDEPTKTPAERARESVAVLGSNFEPNEYRFNRFRAPMTARYKLKFSVFSVWMNREYDRVTPGHRPEPIVIYSERTPSIYRKLGSFDVDVWPTVASLDVWLIAGETIRPDAVRLVRSRPSLFGNPNWDAEGMPGVAFQWMEVEGPLFDQWPPAGHQLQFGDLSMKDAATVNSSSDEDRHGPAGVEVISEHPRQDGERLLRHFLGRAYRRPVTEEDVESFLPLIDSALAAGRSFTEAMIGVYTAVLSSPEFLYFNERPGRLSDRALAERLSYFLWNSPPDEILLQAAESDSLHDPEQLRAQTNRMLDDPRSSRFVEAFLGHWLELHRLGDTAPDPLLYPDYDLDDHLVDSLADETKLYFADLLARDIGVSALIDSDFTFLNERLARHYGIPGVTGGELRRVTLPADSVRGGLLTQGSILKVTANGTTTSPVKRGVWVMSRILGLPPPPPPAAVPAVEPDIRGATTIREQLLKHRSDETCNACHRNIDPAGFALESFDVMGAWRANYRSLGDGSVIRGIGHNGQHFRFTPGPEVDPSGSLPSGQEFQDVRELKKCLLQNQAQLGRNLLSQLVVYATGAPIGFADRPQFETMLKRSQENGYGIRTLVHEVVQSDLFLKK